MQLPIYMDNHATTPVDPRVVEAMFPYFTEKFGNAGSTSHSFGWDAQEAVDEARHSIAGAIGAHEREIVFTSGATESNSLAIRGVSERRRRRGDHIVSVVSEHKAVLDPLERLSRRGFDVTLLSPRQTGDAEAGRIDTEQVATAIRDDTLLVSVMMANNEIGVIQPIAEIGKICKERGVLFHCDATQGVGRIPVDVEELQVDLLSITAHKMFGPKGIGVLYVRRKNPLVRLEPQIEGGGQEGGRRSGTLNVPGIIGLSKALELCLMEMPEEQPRLAKLRNRLYEGLRQTVHNVNLNGPAIDNPQLRLAGNLNVSFSDVDGEALMMNMKEVAVSSGSACSSANPKPSHVLQAIGLSGELARSSLRFGLGRFNTAEEVEYTILAVASSVERLRHMGSIA